MASAEIEGVAGELIDRLVAAADSSENWYGLTWYLTFATGGDALLAVIPDRGPVAPGSVAERKLDTHEVVSRADYFELIRSRLTDLLVVGLREDFLVRSIRDELSRQLRLPTTAHSEERAERMARLGEWAGDAYMIARFRDTLAEDQPSAALLTDEEVAERLLAMRDRLDVTPEAELGGLVAVERWQRVADEYLSDADIELWIDRYSSRVLRGEDQD